MYAPYFGLSKEPFSIAPDPRFLFMSDMHREALAHLLYGVSGGGGFVLLTGEIGAGKTTVCRAFLDQVPPHCVVAYIFNPKLTVYELLQTVCEEFGITVVPANGETPSQKDHVDALNHFLLAAHAASKQAVLIIDEAQSLAADVLEQLRLLTNLETGERKLLQIVLIGQPELRELLASPRLEQLAQRVIARYHLKALSAGETAHYIQHRLAVAGPGAAQRLVDADAVARIHALTGGVPRRINLLCDRAMLGAYAHGKQRVDRLTVEQAAREVFFNAPRKSGEAPERSAVPATPPWWPWAWGALAVVVTAVVVAGVMLGLREPRAASTESAAALRAASAPDAAAPSVVSGASAAATETASSPGATATAAVRADAGTVLAFAYRDEAQAWRELVRWWRADWGAGASCAQTGLPGLACHRNSGGLAALRAVGRPSLLLLRDEVGGNAWIQLVAIGDSDVTLRAGGRRFKIGQGELARIWRGEFVTLWRPPPGWREGSEAATRPELRQWINERLADAGEADAKKPLKDRLSAFQIGQGMTADGLATPATLMRLARPDPKLIEPRLPAEPGA